MGYRYDLVRDEERGGHTLKKHVGRTDEQLEERLRQSGIFRRRPRGPTVIPPKEP